VGGVSVHVQGDFRLCHATASCKHRGSRCETMQDAFDAGSHACSLLVHMNSKLCILQSDSCVQIFQNMQLHLIWGLHRSVMCKS
jgi:hypothetical protein